MVTFWLAEVTVVYTPGVIETAPVRVLRELMPAALPALISGGNRSML
jgi:hypothetical protein